MEPKFLEHEITRYKENFESISKYEGRFALIKGDDEIEIFDTYEDALKAGYQKYAIEPFLVQKINRIETIVNFTRMLRVPTCQA